eukprot:COSAG06_NODE_4931_length_3853_cov_56.996803_1_plen_98_part_00
MALSLSLSLSLSVCVCVCVALYVSLSLAGDSTIQYSSLRSHVCGISSVSHVLAEELFTQGDPTNATKLQQRPTHSHLSQQRATQTGKRSLGGGCFIA